MNADVAYISMPKLGERLNGDAVVVRREVEGKLLLAVIDGLGHGPVAAEAAGAAVACLRAVEFDEPVLGMMQAAHASLRGTRGVAATVCVLRGRKLEACAVGNVQLAAANASVPLVLSSGVLGMRISRFRVCEAELTRGARLALFSDGISSRFRLDEGRHLKPQDACKLAFDRHRKKDDDATILIADLLD